MQTSPWHVTFKITILSIPYQLNNGDTDMSWRIKPKSILFLICNQRQWWQDAIVCWVVGYCAKHFQSDIMVITVTRSTSMPSIYNTWFLIYSYLFFGCQNERCVQTLPEHYHCTIFKVDHAGLYPYLPVIVWPN